MLEHMADKTGGDENEFFYNVMMTQAFNIHSPFEVRKDIDFPKKDELGGVVLKFIGGGAAYFKIITEMPTEEEVQSIYEVGEFLQKSFGDYVVISVMCTPDIELRNIKVLSNEYFSTDFVSSRKEDGDIWLDKLTEKLLKKEEFTINNHIMKVLVPFMSRKNDEEFERKFSEFLDLYSKSGVEEPTVESLVNSCVGFKRWFSDDCVYDFSIFKCMPPFR